ncbi:MAG: hypothetical protein R3C40_07910 [Parvularculaceae bacterium]
MKFLEALGAISALKQKGATFRNFGKRIAKRTNFARKLQAADR